MVTIERRGEGNLISAGQPPSERGVKPGVYALGSVGEEAPPEMFGPSVMVVVADVAGVVARLDRGVEVRGRVEPRWTNGIDFTVEVGEGVVRGVVVDSEGADRRCLGDGDPERTSAAEAPDDSRLRSFKGNDQRVGGGAEVGEVGGRPRARAARRATAVGPGRRVRGAGAGVADVHVAGRGARRSTRVKPAAGVAAVRLHESRDGHARADGLHLVQVP